MTQNEFTNRRQAAIENMRQMNARSVYNSTNHTPSENKQPRKSAPIENKRTENRTIPQNNSLNIPILNNLLKDSDATLIIGLLLILLSENCDKKLLFALVYILM